MASDIDRIELAVVFRGVSVLILTATSAGPLSESGD